MQPPAPERPPSIARVLRDIRHELSTRDPLPPGPMSFSMVRTHRFQRHTLQMLLEYYERYGPVFAFRSVHQRIVAMIGAEANHFVTVSGAEHFSWRKGLFGEHLRPLIGDGLITTDGEYHDRARRIMTPAFHRRRMDAAVAVMLDEAARAIETWRPGDVVDVYEWVRDLAMSIAMRALFGFDPREGGVGHRAATLFERALAFYDTENVLMLLRGPGSPWAKMQRARRALDAIIFAEIEHRRSAVAPAPAPGPAPALAPPPAPGSDEREDMFSMLLSARDERGDGFTALELRDQVMHLLFGGHDTTSSTLSFLLYELSRNPVVLERLLEEQDVVLSGRPPTVDDLLSGLPYLSMVVDETLRLYPPVWFGPRMCVEPFEFLGFRIPAGIHVIHSSWVTHRLPEIFPNPEAFIPERFTPEARRQLPPGGYMPFGGGQRICIGKRFGQLVVKAVATVLLQRFRCELRPGYELRVSKLPTLSPEGGLPMMVRSRRPATPGGPGTVSPPVQATG